MLKQMAIGASAARADTATASQGRHRDRRPRRHRDRRPGPAMSEAVDNAAGAIEMQPQQS